MFKIPNIEKIAILAENQNNRSPDSTAKIFETALVLPKSTHLTT